MDQIGPNMGAAAPRAPFGGWGPGPPQTFDHWPYLETPPPLISIYYVFTTPFQCDPNLAVFSCWISNLDLRLPHICLFAVKSIAVSSTNVLCCNFN